MVTGKTDERFEHLKTDPFIGGMDYDSEWVRSVHSSRTALPTGRYSKFIIPSFAMMGQDFIAVDDLYIDKVVEYTGGCFVAKSKVHTGGYSLVKEDDCPRGTFAPFLMFLRVFRLLNDKSKRNKNLSEFTVIGSMEIPLPYVEERLSRKSPVFSCKLEYLGRVHYTHLWNKASKCIEEYYRIAFDVFFRAKYDMYVGPGLNPMSMLESFNYNKDRKVDVLSSHEIVAKYLPKSNKRFEFVRNDFVLFQFFTELTHSDLDKIEAFRHSSLMFYYVGGGGSVLFGLCSYYFCNKQFLHAKLNKDLKLKIPTREFEVRIAEVVWYPYVLQCLMLFLAGC